jgi:hypothetical protein
VKIDEFELSVNRANQKAAPAARGIFKDALTQMSLDDARKILTGGDTSASEKLTAAFRPTVEAAMADNRGITQYNQLMASVPSLPFANSRVSTSEGMWSARL